jgi:hypothetical protein
MEQPIGIRAFEYRQLREWELRSQTATENGVVSHLRDA